MGLTLSLLVSLASVQFGVTNRFESGLIVVVVCLAGTLSGFALRDVAPVRTSNLGALGLIAGVVITLAGLEADSLTLFVLGSAVGGLGLGASMSGSIRTMSALPAPDERGEFFAAVYVVGYLAFSVPAVIAGFAAVHFGLLHTTYVYGAGVILLALAVPALSTSAPAPAAAPVPVPVAAGGCRD
jgi:sugar phosphate permease